MTGEDGDQPDVGATTPLPVDDRTPFGWSLALDLFGCAPAPLVDRSYIVEYAKRLCDGVLGMNRFGDPIVEWFGGVDPSVEGLSLVQLIEMSSVVGHFSGVRRSAHIDIFSCRPFANDEAVHFSIDWFMATDHVARHFVR